MILHQACIDDSGTGGRGVFALSGYLLPAEDWNSFSDNWQRVLHEPPTIAYLKMREAAKLEKQFRRWRATQRDAKLRQLIAVLRAYNVVALASFINQKDYSQRVKGKMPEEYDNPYFFCFYDLILGTLQYQRRKHPDWNVQFVFDDQGRLGQKVSCWYVKLKSLYSSNLQSMMGATPDFRKDTEFSPLQAADALAWVVRRISENHCSNPYPLPVDVMNGFCDIPTLRWHWDAERLSNFILDSADILRDLESLKRKLKSIEGDEKLDFKARIHFR